LTLVSKFINALLNNVHTKQKFQALVYCDHNCMRAMKKQRS